MSDADFCVILNTGSGDQKAAARVCALQDAFRRHPGRFDLRVVRTGTAIAPQAARAVEAGTPTIVAAGGDGTICAVASQVAGSDSRLGVLPLGTFNYFARSLGIPEDLDAAVEALVRGTARARDVGEVNGRVFLNNASLGAYPAVLQNRERVYRRWGRSRIAAYWSALDTLVSFRAPLRLTITTEGTTRSFRTPLVFASSNAFQLDLLKMDGADCVREGRLAIFIAPDGERRDQLRLAWHLATGTMIEHRDFELICGSDVLIATERAERLVARDGERARMRGPFRFRVRAGALRVVVPEGGAV